MKIPTSIVLTLLSGSLYGSQKDFDYKTSISASEMSREMFGPVSPKERKTLAINVGRIGLSLRTDLNCGKLGVEGDINLELSHLTDQVKTLAETVKNNILNPQVIALGAICYYKPTVCSYIKHLQARLQESLSLQMDACQAMDKYIVNQANKGLKIRQAEAVNACMDGKSVNGENLRECSKQSGRARNLLEPFKDSYSTRSQNTLESILRVVKQDRNYELWSSLLGEVEIKRNGWWDKLFPNDLVRPDQFVDNVALTGKNFACNFNLMEKVINSKKNLSEFEGIDYYVRKAIKHNLSGYVVRDLKSLPDLDAARACNSLGASIAHSAIKLAVADGKSSMTAALTNGALPDDLRAFYENRTNLTFSSIQDLNESADLIPIRENLKQIAQLAREYRKLNRDGASRISAKRFFNSQNKIKNSCDDEFSCTQ